ncbi:MAG: hypothetical protein ACFB0C_17975 [Leptolyngbyaceae cyanobacterium]
MPGKLNLDGFVYEKLSKDAPATGDKRLFWLRLQGQDAFSPQSYEQLAQILRASGHSQSAIEILIGEQYDLIRHGDLPCFKKVLNWFLGLFISYGYQPHKALYWSFGIIVLGAIFFYLGHSQSPSLISASNVDLFWITPNTRPSTPSVTPSTDEPTVLLMPSVIPSASTSTVLSTPLAIPSASTSTVLSTPSVIPLATTPTVLSTPSVIPSTNTPTVLSTPSVTSSTSTSIDLQYTISDDYPVFNALVYSIDVFIPIVDLHQQSYWLPNANRGADVVFSFKWGAFLRWYFWFHIASGWFFSSLWIAGFTGLVRNLD